MLSSATTWYQADPQYVLLPAGAALRHRPRLHRRSATACAPPSTRAPAAACASARGRSAGRQERPMTRAHRIRPAAGPLGGRAGPARALASSSTRSSTSPPGDPPRSPAARAARRRRSHQVAHAARPRRPAVPAQYWHFLQGIVRRPATTQHRHRRRALRGALPRASRTRATSRSPQLILDASCRSPPRSSLGAMVLWLVLGVGTGVLSALRRGRLTERAADRRSPSPASPRPSSSSASLLMIVVCG